MSDRKQRRQLLGTALLGLACLMGASIAWPPWTPPGEIRWWSASLRIALLAIAIVQYARFLRFWLVRHADSVHAEWKVGSEGFPELGELDDEGYFQRVESSADLFDGLDTANALLLRQHLSAPHEFRQKVMEDVDIRLQQFVRRVEIQWDQARIPQIGTARVLPIMRRPTDAPPRELTVQGGRLLNSVETRALLVRMAEVLEIEPRDFAAAIDGDDLPRPSSGASETDPIDPQGMEEASDPPALSRAAIRRALIKVTDRGFRFLGRHRHSRTVRSDSSSDGDGHDEDEDEDIAISEETKKLLVHSRTTRHYIAWYEPASRIDDLTTVFEYRSDPDRPKAWPHVDAWRARKDRWRTTLRMPRRFVYVRLDKALSSHTYVLRVHCDEELYFEESNVWAVEPRAWVRSADRLTFYKSYLNWEAPTGKSFTSLTASRLGGHLPWSTLYFALRLTEKPPGILGGASAISFASFVSVWLVGLLGLDANGTDPIAFILALPGLFASVVGFSTASAIEGRRSGTGIGSLAASMATSLLGVVLFISESRHEGALAPWVLHEGEHRVFVLWMSDLWWVALVVVAGFVFLVTMGTLVMRVQRYAVLTGVRSEKDIFDVEPRLVGNLAHRIYARLGLRGRVPKAARGTRSR